MEKVCPVMGIARAFRGNEFTKMKVNGIQKHSALLLCTIPDPKTRKKRVFVVNNSSEGPNLLQMYNKYLALRPPQIEHQRLFVNYKSGKCTVQPVVLEVLNDHSVPPVPQDTVFVVHQLPC